MRAHGPIARIIAVTILSIVWIGRSSAAEAPAPNEYGWILEPTRTMQAEGFDWAHTIQIALPRGYHESDQNFPVLWLTDGYAYFSIAMQTIGALASTKEAPETIIVSVGPPLGTEQMEFQTRRSYDFSPSGDISYEGPGGEALRKMIPEGMEIPTGGASGFLGFILDAVRPALEQDYRFHPEQQTLFGHSGGGMFVGFALFDRPGTFDSYICGSPSLNAGNFEIFKMEEKYAASNADLPISIFYGAAEPEILSTGLSEWGLVSSLVRLAEILYIRQYPSLNQKVRIYQDRNHLTVVPGILIDGLRWIGKMRAENRVTDAGD